MFITRNWLNHFLDIASVKDEEITVALNSLGFEVDSYKSYKNLNDKLKIGHVGSVNKIEGTHLNYCFVDINDDMPSAIVCGASNVKEGQFVMVAKPGTRIANGLKIENREIQGRDSEGMICALNEIGLENNKIAERESDWIYTVNLREDAYKSLGSSATLDLIGFNDSVWECDLTLNRSDALGALMLLKELGNYFKVKPRDFADFDEKIISHKPISDVKLEIAANCDEFVRVLSTTTIERKKIITVEDNWDYSLYSPDDLWLRNSGYVPTGKFFIDICAIVSLEVGQPVILIDPKKVKNKLSIKNIPDKDKEIGLKLCDGDNVVSTFGVDTNEDYLPTIKSEEIMVIIPSLDPITMRKQQKAYNTSSIDMQRYMKPVSDKLYELAYARLIAVTDKYDLLGKISEVEIIKDSKVKPVVIEMTDEYIKSLLGIEISSKEIMDLFEEIDFFVTLNDCVYTFEVDKYRTDISTPADIVEEIARLYGYDKITPQPLILKSVQKEQKLNDKIKNQVETILLGNEFLNVKTYSLQAKEVVEKWDFFNYKKSISLDMPLSVFRETYRLSLLPSIIETVIFNSNKGNKELKIYEFADVYNGDGLRQKHLALAIAGSFFSSKPYKIDVKNEWAIVKGLTESIIDKYNLEDEIEFENISNPINEIHPFINAKLTYKKEVVGFITKLNPAYEEKSKIMPTFVVELSISKLNELRNNIVRANDVSKFQKTSRDISFILKNNDNFNKVINDLKVDVKYIDGIELTDIYEDDELKANKTKSYTISVVFNSFDNQLTDDEVNEEFVKMTTKLSKKGIVIR